MSFNRVCGNKIVNRNRYNSCKNNYNGNLGYNIFKKLKSSTLQAYTLIELSILLIASGIVLGSIFYAYQLLQHQYAKQVTISRQEIVMRAIGRYVKQYGSLPYPTKQLSGLGQGLQQRIPGLGDKLPQNDGFIPWRTLGLPKLIAYDGNGSPMFYIVNIDLGARKDVKRRLNGGSSNSFADYYRYVSDYYHKTGIIPEIPEISTDKRESDSGAHAIYSDVLFNKMLNIKLKMVNSGSNIPNGMSSIHESTASSVNSVQLPSLLNLPTSFYTVLKPSIFLDEISVLFGSNFDNSSKMNQGVSGSGSNSMLSSSVFTQIIDTSLGPSYSDCIAVALVGHANKKLSMQFNKIDLNTARKSGMIVSYITRMNMSLYGGPTYHALRNFNARKLLNVHMPNKLLRIVRKYNIGINLIPKFTRSKASHLSNVYREIMSKGYGPNDYDVFNTQSISYSEDSGKYSYVDLGFGLGFGLEANIRERLDSFKLLNTFRLDELKLFDI